MKIRDILPKRRNSPSKSEKGKNYRKHRKDLLEDFNKSCGYCGAYDGFGHTITYFEIDHFVPKDFLIKNKSKIGICNYSNLVYSCRFCNNNKTMHWPSQRDDVYIIGEEGFIDPCDSDYENHLYRTEEGAILWNTPIGKWMSTVAFKFDERTEEIKLLWRYNRTRLTIEKIVDELNSYPPESVLYTEIKQELNLLWGKYYFLQQELEQFYNG